MSRSYYDSKGPFLCTGVEPSPGMDCLQLRQCPAPFHYLISEQAKSLVALQELQNEVGALLEFRDLVIETFPNLRSKMSSAATAPTTASASSSSSSNIPIAVRRDWEPGVRVRRKLNSASGGKEERAKKTESTVQDSGFSTETSSKETHSSSANNAEHTETEDELWNLLDVIHRKGTRLKNEVEALQGAIREQSNVPEEPNFQRALFHASADDVRQLKRERDMLLDRVAEMEAEVLAGRVHTSRLQEDLENLLATKQDLEEQLKAVVNQRGEINSRIRDLHLQFVDVVSEKKQHRTKVNHATAGSAASVGDLSDLPKVSVPDKKKFEEILNERDPLILKKHLLTTTVENQVLQEKLETATKKEVGLTDQLDRTREENEDLKFQLEDKNIELEGTKARVRVLEQLQKPTSPSPDVIPASESPPNRDSSDLNHHHHHHHQRRLSRSEITTASMKAMSPYPMHQNQNQHQQQLDHSSSTESAHDQAASEASRRKTPPARPSKIPLKSYAAPKPPSSSSASSSISHKGAARSRSGDSLNRQSWRNKSEGGSLKKSPAARKSLGSGGARNSSASTTVRDSPDPKMSPADAPPKLRPSWILSAFPDSLDDEPPWSTSLDLNDGRFYDSIDSASANRYPSSTGGAGEALADHDDDASFAVRAFRSEPALAGE